MIKVNLLENRTASSGGIDAPPNADVLAAKNLVIMLSLSVGLYLYESQNINGLKKSIKRSKAEVGVVQNKVTALKELAGEAKKLSKELNQVKDRVKVIKELSKQRMVELKTLDSLQGIIPEKVWFESIIYFEGKFEVKGVAVDIEDVTLFKSALDGQAGFKNVKINNTKEKPVENGETVHAFSLVFNVKVKEDKVE